MMNRVSDKSNAEQVYLTDKGIDRILFRDDEHKKVYNDICSRMWYLDCYHRSFAYLLALDTVLREHIEDLYDFQEGCIKTDGLHKGFQTGTSFQSLERLV